MLVSCPRGRSRQLPTGNQRRPLRQVRAGGRVAGEHSGREQEPEGTLRVRPWARWPRRRPCPLGRESLSPSSHDAMLRTRPSAQRTRGGWPAPAAEGPLASGLSPSSRAQDRAPGVPSRTRLPMPSSGDGQERAPGPSLSPAQSSRRWSRRAAESALRFSEPQFQPELQSGRSAFQIGRGSERGWGCGGPGPVPVLR